MGGRGRLGWMIAFVGLGFLLRLLHLFEIRVHDPFFSSPTVDPSRYHAWAKQIASGDMLGTGTFHLGPLYPLTLGGVYAMFGDGFDVGRWLNIVLGTLSVALIGVVGRRLFDPVVGVVAAAIAATYPMLIYVGGELVQENVQVPLNALVLLLCARALEAPRSRNWLAAGTSVGLSAWARANVLLFALMLAIWLLCSRAGRQGLGARSKWVAWFALGVVLAVLPVTLRNAAIARDFVLLTDNAGVNLYVGNNPDATGHFSTPGWIPAAQFGDPDLMFDFARRHAEAARGGPLKPSQISSHWTGMALEWIAAAPLEAVRLWCRKAWLLLSETEFGVERQIVIDREFSMVLRWPLPGFLLIVPWALLGCVLTVSDGRRGALPLVFLGSQALALVMFFVSDRYRLPLAPAAIPLAAFAMVWVVRAARGRRWRFVCAGGLAILAATWACARTGESNVTASNFFNLGNRFRDSGRFLEAIEQYRIAIEIDRTHVSAWNNLALVLETDPATRDAAIDAWRQVLALARASGDRGRAERAQRHLKAIGEGISNAPAGP